MALVREIHVDDIGTMFKITLYDDEVIVDVSGATVMQMLFLKPDGTNLTKTAYLFSDGTDGIIKYSTIADDLDIHGKWKEAAS